ncbi:MAG: MFS transporter [Candidatus Anstonellales archaeon]
MKKIAAINFLDHFVFYSLSLIFPLYLAQKNLSLSEIGLLLSIMPFVSIAFRLLFAYVADRIGYKLFFIIDGISMALANVIYAFASLPIHFGLGKISEAVSTQSFWAVNRTAIYFSSNGREEKSAAFMDGVRRVAIALGTLASGFFLTSISFENTFILLSAISLFLAFIAFTLKGKITPIRFNMKDFSLAVLMKRKRSFWQTSLSMVFSVSVLTVLVMFALPLFMKEQLGLSYEEIGVLFTIFYVASAIGSFITLKKDFQLYFLPLMVFLSLSIIFLPLSPAEYFFILFVIFSLSYGILFAFHEYIIAKETKGSKTVSLDIGVLHIPTRIAQTIVLILGGFLAQIFGFVSVFLLSFFMFVGFSVVAHGLIKKN